MVTLVPDSPDSSPMAEPALIARACEGEAAAFERLVERHQWAVFRVLGRMLVPAGLHTMVDDLAQETFIRVLRALPRFDPEGPARFRTWVLTIATRLAINELQRVRAPTEPLDELVDQLVGTVPTDALARRREIATAVAGAITRLSPEQRATFVLRHHDGLELREIAEALDVEVGTVKSRLSRARASLRRALLEVHGE